MDILQYAIQMEEDGESFYRAQALENAGNAFQTVFTYLAEDEARHASIIKKKAENIKFSLNDENVANVTNVFKNAAEFDFGINVARQTEVYKKALGMELASIQLYQKLLSESKGDEAFYKFLIRQEEEHYALFQEIIKMMNRPNVWVENAEFGTRSEY